MFLFFFFANADLKNFRWCNVIQQIKKLSTKTLDDVTTDDQVDEDHDETRDNRTKGKESKKAHENKVEAQNADTTDNESNKAHENIIEVQDADTTDNEHSALHKKRYKTSGNRPRGKGSNKAHKNKGEAQDADTTDDEIDILRIESTTDQGEEVVKDDEHEDLVEEESVSIKGRAKRKLVQKTRSENIEEDVEIMDTIETEPIIRVKAGKKMKSIKDMAKDIDFTSGSENEKTPTRRSKKVTKAKWHSGTSKWFVTVFIRIWAHHCF